MEENVILSVVRNEDNYTVNLAQGMSLGELGFSIAVIIKCLKRDGHIEDNKVMLDLINKYLTDPQYDELVEKDEETKQEGDETNEKE